MSPADGATGKKILVCDDDETLVDIFTVLFEEAGYQVVGAGDGPSCLKALERERPDLLILDVDLPGRDGFAVLEQVRASQAYPDMRVIMITAHERPDDVARAKTLGADDFVVKPFEPAELVARVNSVSVNPHGSH